MTDKRRVDVPRLPPQGGVSVYRGAAAAALPASTRSTARPSSTARARTPDLLAVIGRLQPRDYVIAHLLAEHRTLTTPQLAAILFTSPSRTRARLYQLRTLGWVDCFTPTAADGRQPTHWVPGPLSATYTALHDDRTPPTPRLLRQQRNATAASPQLRHTVGANQFFIDLLAYARHHPGTRLARWWSPTTAAAATARRVHPDGHGVWEHDDAHTEAGVRQVGFWLEHDTGTETIGRLVAKIEPYRRLRRDGGPDYPLLFHLPSAAREAHLHRQLTSLDHARDLAVVATTTHDRHPAAPVWQIAGGGPDRVGLADLPGAPGQAGPYHPGPPGPEQNPLGSLIANTGVDPRG